MTSSHPFHEDLRSLGFRAVEEGRKGVVQYALQATRYLVFWVHWDPGSPEILFTWELDIGEFVSDHGMQIGANEKLNLFLFPQHDARGPADISFVAQELDRADSLLRAIDLTARG